MRKMLRMRRRYKKFTMYKAYPSGYQSGRLRRTLAKYRGLGIFNRRTGEREIRERRNVYRMANKMAFDPIYGYPTNNSKTRSLSLRQFAKQVSDLRKSHYFIDQYRGAVQNMYGSRVPKARVKWHSDIDTLALQARNVLAKEEQELARPVTEDLDSRIPRNPAVPINPATRQGYLVNGGQLIKTEQG